MLIGQTSRRKLRKVAKLGLRCCDRNGSVAVVGMQETFFQCQGMEVPGVIWDR